MTDLNSVDFSSLEPKEFAQLVKTTPDSQITEVMNERILAPQDLRMILKRT